MSAQFSLSILICSFSRFQPISSDKSHEGEKVSGKPFHSVLCDTIFFFNERLPFKLQQNALAWYTEKTKQQLGEDWLSFTLSLPLSSWHFLLSLTHPLFHVICAHRRTFACKSLLKLLRAALSPSVVPSTVIMEKRASIEIDKFPFHTLAIFLG